MSILRTLILIYYLCWVICFKISICVLTWDVSVQLISSKDLFLALNYIFYHIPDVMQIALFIPDSSLSFSLSYFHQKGKFSLKLNCYAHVKQLGNLSVFDLAAEELSAINVSGHHWCLTTWHFRITCIVRQLWLTMYLTSRFTV